MGEGTKVHASGGLPGKFIEQINYQEIDEGEVSQLNYSEARLGNRPSLIFYRFLERAASALSFAANGAKSTLPLKYFKLNKSTLPFWLNFANFLEWSMRTS